MKDTLLISGFSVVLLGCAMVLGAMIEHKIVLRHLEAMIINTTEQTYYEGYGDAEKDCRNGKIK